MSSYLKPYHRNCLTSAPPPPSPRTSLERALGGILVDRSHRPVRPTELGTAFLPHAREVLAALERGAEAVDEHSGTLRGRVVKSTQCFTPIQSFSPSFSIRWDLPHDNFISFREPL